MAEEIQTICVTVRDKLDEFELAFKIRANKPFKKVIQAWMQNISPEKQNSEYEFYFGALKLDESMIFSEVEGLCDNDTVTIVCNPIGAQAEEARTESPADGKEEKEGQQDRETEVAQEREPEPEEPQSNAAEQAEVPAEAPAAESPVAEVPSAEAPTVQVPSAEAPSAEAPAAEAPPAEAPAAEGTSPKTPAATVPGVVSPDETLMISVRDCADNDLLTFRVRPNKTVAKMMVAWKSNQPDHKQHLDFDFSFEDIKLDPNMTFGEIPNMRADSEIIAKQIERPAEASSPNGSKRASPANSENEEDEPKKKKAKTAKAKAAPKEKAAPKKKTAPKEKTAKAKPSGNTGQDIPNTARIELQQDNPKKSGSQASARYELYKKATTKQEYFDLGGAKLDWPYDFSRGWIKVLDD
eukprot:GEMP01029934.1.p1 GENE.GEMP01029934.1~~GEMP01029934.1.p1  ORF type:complete len:410 (+),score=110.74 GEMP01029934.1:69-1298(+)